MLRSYTNRVALITGAASGIGRGVARALARRGAAVAIADIDVEGAQRLAAELNAEARRAIALRCDVSEPDAFAALRDAALGTFGRIDLVMNNVGALTRGLPEHIPVEEWQRLIDINLMSVVRSNAVFLPLLLAQGEGYIVNTASFAGLYTYAYDRLPYAATKAAVIQLSEGLALYLKPKGIGVSVLCPGPVATNIAASIRSFGPPTATRPPGAQFAVRDPDEVGEEVAEAVLQGRFMITTDQQVRALLVRRATDFDAFLDEQIAALPR